LTIYVEKIEPKDIIDTENIFSKEGKGNLKNSEYHYYWGDLHNHCGITYGFGSLENALKAAEAQLDFCAVTGHAMWPDIPARTPETDFLISFHEEGFAKLKTNWPFIRDTLHSHNREGEFVTFYGYEMHGSHLGDYHLISPDDDIPLVYSDTPSHILGTIPNHRAVMIPHHIAYPPEYRGINWDAYNPAISPVVEVCSKHGIGMSDRSPGAYYHNMGPRDPNTTVYEGLRRGYHFGFVGSSDHHAGYPGSYGDGKMAVLCGEKTRESIYNAILARRCYAVTGDKILCDFTADGIPMGSVLYNSGKRRLSLRVEACHFIDKLILYKNLRPLRIINGELLNTVNTKGRYKLRIEMGWGNNTGPYTWNGQLNVDGGAFAGIETCFRGRSILAPSKDTQANDEVNSLDNRVIKSTAAEAAWVCQTLKNVSTLHPGTSAVILEIEGNPTTRIQGTVNCLKVDISLEKLLQNGFTQSEKPFNSQTVKFHTLVPESQYCVSVDLEDDPETDNDFYHAEIFETNGSCAFVSPVYYCLRA
jgi:hypothetical protein